MLSGEIPPLGFTVPNPVCFRDTVFDAVARRVGIPSDDHGLFGKLPHLEPNFGPLGLRFGGFLRPSGLTNTLGFVDGVFAVEMAFWAFWSLDITGDLTPTLKPTPA